MRTISRYAEIARQSLKENQPAFHDELKAAGKLEAFLVNLAKQAEDMASSIHQRNLAEGVPPGTSLAEADNQAIRDNLLFESKDPQDGPDGYCDPDPSTEASKTPSPDFEPGEFKAWNERFRKAFVGNLNENVRRQQKKK